MAKAMAMAKPVAVPQAVGMVNGLSQGPVTMAMAHGHGHAVGGTN